MTRRKSGETQIRTLRKISGGTSYGVTIPLEYIRKLNWKAKQKVEVNYTRTTLLSETGSLELYSNKTGRIP